MDRSAPYFCGVHLLLLLLLLAPAGVIAGLRIDFSQFNPVIERSFGRGGLPTAWRWQETLEGNRGRGALPAGHGVNAFIHDTVAYRADQELYGAHDYWATPSETLGHRLGDCEDYAILAYISLRHVGISDDKLRLIYVKADTVIDNEPIRGAHMVLGYYPTPDSEPRIIDSLIEEILPASQRPDLKPVFSFNATGLYVGGTSGSNQGLSRWRDLIERLRREGIELEAVRG